MLKSYKYRLYPTKKQAEYLNQVFGSVRFVWNKLVGNFNSYNSDQYIKGLSEKTLKDNHEYYWLNDSISFALQQKRIDFEESCKQYFNKNRKVKLGRMKFKKKGSKESFRIPAQAMSKINLTVCDTGKIKFPKISPMKIVIDRKFTGIPKSYTVSRNPSGEYYVSILVDEEIELKPNTGKSIGIDLGLSHLMALSNGIKVNNPRWFRESQAELKKAHRHLSRKKKGSNRYNRQRIKVTKIHQKITNQREWVLHNLSTWLVNSYDHIFVEDLNVSGMKKSKLAKSISDASFSKFVSMLLYKSSWYGKVFHKIDRFYPSSKTCSCCGYKLSELNLSIREWNCPSCNSNHDRDLNAAINILNRGFNDLYGITSEELSDYRRREEVRPEVELPKASSMKRLFKLTRLV